ncbi:methylmalonyl Co-A mutase-associated GTPase MeaB [bacterium]|nr:methylmalonyl Co-A mutase-associated GTPase MeaB [bacterium]MBU1651144.1 methylmalonyl Co-A mutase-associated GTPase MeaB [bacterium]MBU1881542.1 methylmalonyl Co-A mutase-associated GTPase MeaB [bacterium]
MDIAVWMEKFDQGDVRALSKIITCLENSNGLIPDAVKPIFSRTGNAYRIGITGPPGAGKSTLVDGLCNLYRKKQLSIGVIAVDPTSPFSGGALLGDRVRMTRVGFDAGIYVRSMATRGTLGGLAEAALDAADVLDAFGKDIVILETVGVGQSELDIARAADSTVVVLVPESGDGVQAMKAGLMEIGDLFVLNKADRPLADRAVQEIEAALDLKREHAIWNPPVIPTIASRGEGLDKLIDALDKHRITLQESGALEVKRINRRKERIRQIAERELRRRLWSDPRLRLLDKNVEAEENPFAAAHKLIDDFLKG